MFSRSFLCEEQWEILWVTFITKHFRILSFKTLSPRHEFLPHSLWGKKKIVHSKKALIKCDYFFVCVLFIIIIILLYNTVQVACHNATELEFFSFPDSPNICPTRGWDGGSGSYLQSEASSRESFQAMCSFCESCLLCLVVQLLATLWTVTHQAPLS